MKTNNKKYMTMALFGAACMMASAQNSESSLNQRLSEPVKISAEMQAWIDHLTGADRAADQQAGPRRVSATSWSYPDYTPATPYGGGSGTEYDPYLISTPQHLANLAYMVNNGTSYSGYYFKMTDDIQLNSNVLATDGSLNGGSYQSWTPIGTSSYPFAGNFDGDNHVILGAYINNSSSNQGLFGYILNSCIKNTGITDSYIKANSYSASLVGYFGNSTILGCYSNENTIIGDYQCIGGLIGGSEQSYNTISKCYSNSIVVASRLAGGVCGFGYSYASFDHCYNLGSVTINDDLAGGIAGGTNSSGTFINCYNYGTIRGGSGVYPMGGTYNVITNCYYLEGTTYNSAGAISMPASAFSDGTVLSLIDPEGLYFTQGSDGYPVLVGVGEGAVVNRLSMTVENCYPGQTIALPISMTNEDEISSIQFDVTLPAGVSVANVVLTDRAYDHIASYNVVASGATRVVLTSFSNEYFEGNEGEVCQVILNVDEEAAAGMYNIQLNNITLSTPASQTFSPGNCIVPFEIYPHTFSLYSYDSINLYVGESFSTGINMLNTLGISSIQFDVNLPTGVEITSITIGSRAYDHICSSNVVEGGATRIVCTSFSNEIFEGTDGDVAQISYTIAEDAPACVSSIIINNIIFSTPLGARFFPSDVYIPLTIREHLKGDANNDDVVDVADVTMIVNYIYGENPEGFSAANADFNNDGFIDVADIAAVINYALTH